MSTHKPCFWCPSVPSLYAPLSKSPSLAGMLHREWTKMPGVSVGVHGVFYPLSQIGEHGGKLGMMSEEESRPGRRNISRRALAVSHARDKSRKARPGAELEAGDPGRTRGRHRAERGAWMVGCVNCRASGRAPGLGFSRHLSG